jgi:hypothetical protein
MSGRWGLMALDKAEPKVPKEPKSKVGSAKVATLIQKGESQLTAGQPVLDSLRTTIKSLFTEWSHLVDISSAISKAPEDIEGTKSAIKIEAVFTKVETLRSLIAGDAIGKAQRVSSKTDRKLSAQAEKGITSANANVVQLRPIVKAISKIRGDLKPAAQAGDADAKKCRDKLEIFLSKVAGLRGYFPGA